MRPVVLGERVDKVLPSLRGPTVNRKPRLIEVCRRQRRGIDWTSPPECTRAPAQDLRQLTGGEEPERGAGGLDQAGDASVHGEHMKRPGSATAHAGLAPRPFDTI